jgi:hypothetical protein
MDNMSPEIGTETTLEMCTGMHCQLQELNSRKAPLLVRHRSHEKLRVRDTNTLHSVSYLFLHVTQKYLYLK